jgi:hypothetical protein
MARDPVAPRARLLERPIIDTVLDVAGPALWFRATVSSEEVRDPANQPRWPELRQS